MNIPKPDLLTRLTKSLRIKGSIKDDSYNFPASLDNQELRKKIGYVDLPVLYQCGTCEYYKKSNCTKWKITVKDTACCKSWEEK